jgi:hypothetical protein
MTAMMERMAMNRASAAAREEEPDDEGMKELRAYTMQGVRTPLLLNGLNNVVVGIKLGDPSADQRLSGMIQDLFGSIPLEETRKTLADLEFFREHHAKYRCEDAECPSHTVYQSAAEKLKQRLAASPAN